MESEWTEGAGYPNDRALERIKAWPVANRADAEALLDFVSALWNYDDYFSVSNGAYIVSTGGWSGNEDLIGALRENAIFWMTCWESSQRGGHHAFDVSRLPRTKEPTP